MGIIFLVMLGAACGGSGLYFVHGCKRPEAVAGKIIGWGAIVAFVQDLMDARAKDRARP